MSLKKYSFLILFFFLAACDNSKQEQANLQKEVIDNHDILMVKLDDIMFNKQKLDSLKANTKYIIKEHPETDTVAIKSSIDSLKVELTQADNAMMDWMHQFNPDHTGKSHEEIMSYLNKQKIKIDSVKTLFDQSLSKSDQFISKH